jgi:hypothetical protein
MGQMADGTDEFIVPRRIEQRHDAAEIFPKKS